MLAMTVIAISCCAILFWWRTVAPGYGPFWRAAEWWLMDSLLWFPAIFVAFAIGRKTLTVWMVVIFAVAEAVATAYFQWVWDHWS